MPRAVAILVLLAGCGLDELFGEEPECYPHTAYWPDADGDGVGDDAGRVYFACDQPDGWVTVPPDTDPSDTDPSDTDPVDTDPVDTDPVDTDPDTDLQP